MLSKYIVVIFVLVSHLAHGQIELSLDPKSNNKYTKLMCSLESNRNLDISKYSDLSPHAPDGYKIPGIEGGKEIWFPVIDVNIIPSMKMVVEFENFQDGDAMCWNGQVTDDCRPIKQTLIFKDYLAHWENQIFVTSQTATINNVKIQFPVITNQQGKISIETLADSWGGRIEVSGFDGKKWMTIKDTTLSENRGNKETTSISKPSEENLNQALNATLEFLMKSQDKNPLSPYYGGLYLFYDLDEQIYRRPDWVWSYGPSIKLFLDASQKAKIANELGYEKLIETSKLMAETSLKHQITDTQHPAYGLVACRNDPRMDTPNGIETFSSPADSYFLAGWGWIPYYKATGDERFLGSTVLMTNQIERIQRYDELIEQDYLFKARKWKNWTMDESGFGMKGAEAIYEVAHDPHFQEIGRKYITGLLKYLERPDGLWDRTWHRNDSLRGDNGWGVAEPRGTPVLIETKYSTRGLGWAMIGLLSSHGMMKDEGYLEKAIKMADHLMAGQHPDGYWPFLFQGGNENEISVKGTTLWSLLFYELYHYTNDPKHLATARKALLWCMNNQNMNDHSLGYGGISEITSESGVVYCRWNEVICTYAMAWYGLAILEELKITN